MQLVPASNAARLSGLTRHQLREWCGRRGLVAPDVPPAGRGRNALYSWQTILALRLLKELHERFGVEVGRWGPAIGSVQGLLRKRSFPDLSDASVCFESNHVAQLIDGVFPAGDNAALIVPLSPHLEALVSGLEQAESSQFPLFPAVRVGRR